MPIPSADLWWQVPIVGVFVLFLVVLAYIARRMWIDFTTWQRNEEAQRQMWRKEQDEFQASKQQERDRQWQEFFERINSQNSMAITQLTQTIGELVREVRGLREEHRKHDVATRRNLGSRTRSTDKEE